MTQTDQTELCLDLFLEFTKQFVINILFGLYKQYHNILLNQFLEPIICYTTSKVSPA